MVLVEVGEHEDGEADAVEAPERRAVRGRLHRAAAVARVEHLAEEPLQVDRLGGRPGGRAALAVDAGLDRAEQAGPAPGGGEHRVEQKGGRRLPGRAGDARDGQLRGRPPEELVGARPPSPRASPATTSCGTGEVERPLDDERDRAVRDRLRREVVPVGALPGDAEEERPGRRGAGVVGEVAYLGRAPARRPPPARARRSAAPGPRRASLTAASAATPALESSPKWRKCGTFV